MVVQRDYTSGSDSKVNPVDQKFVYDEIERRSDVHDFNVYISYLEIYNENAYDLLDREHLELPLERWNKVTMYEDDDKNLHLKNLSVHFCENEK